MAAATKAARGRREAARIGLGAAASYLALTGILSALGVLAFLGGRSLGGGGSPSLPTSASSEAVSLRGPSGWGPTSPGERPTVPGLNLREAVVRPPAPPGNRA